MKNLLIYSASEDSKQSLLAAKYIESWELGVDPNPQDFIVKHVNPEAENDITYDIKVVAMYPHVYSRSGNQSVVTVRVTDAQESFINGLASAIDILGEDTDNNPDTDYEWADPDPAHEAKFRAVVGQTFFTGEGNPGDENYIAPRKKLAVLA